MFKEQFVPRSKDSVSVTKQFKAVLCKNAACAEIHTKHINALRGHKLEFLYVKRDGTYNNH
jgi:hypothetical protein